jgi:hypothetical protein
MTPKFIKIKHYLDLSSDEISEYRALIEGTVSYKIYNNPTNDKIKNVYSLIISNKNTGNMWFYFREKDDREIIVSNLDALLGCVDLSDKNFCEKLELIKNN